ncbi:MAG: bifunctional precorrin-2 dehydrogenase/sirohydrochlorin ferrochelatase, partial [Spirochaetales bacterium]|nr:bifunctional precorrin-2 dehydrogenase/sirohydrochlorin ferrochelatase [Spirochaetales bacterium]
MYPIFLKLDSTPCLVVGGGTVAARKVKGLLTASAVVTVLAPKVCRELRFLTDFGRISWICRGFAQGALEGYRLVITAT